MTSVGRLVLTAAVAASVAVTASPASAADSPRADLRIASFTEVTATAYDVTVANDGPDRTEFTLTVYGPELTGPADCLGTATVRCHDAMSSGESRTYTFCTTAVGNLILDAEITGTATDPAPMNNEYDFAGGGYGTPAPVHGRGMPTWLAGYGVILIFGIALAAMFALTGSRHRRIYRSSKSPTFWNSLRSR